MELGNQFDYSNGIYLGEIKEVPFEELYLKIRKLEGRLYPDEIVKKLPEINKNHQHYLEWEKRKDTLNRFTTYLSNKKVKKILEIGCGNGWFTNCLSNYCAQIIGQDINKTELEQAARLFKVDAVEFVCTFDLIDLVKYWQPDLIVFNASLHYFNPEDKIVQELKQVSKKKIEIHVLDTFFYTDSREAASAKIRTEEYYAKYGVKELANFYYHYITSDIKAEILRKKPSKWKQRFNKKTSPFPWLRIK